MKQWLGLAQQIWQANTGALQHPFKLTYVVTKECHSRCVNCKIWQVQPKNELTLNEIQRFAQRNPNFSWIDFTGGEPTDRPDFVEIVRAFTESAKNLIFVHFPTNGLKPDRIVEVAEAVTRLKPPKFVISVSIDGPEKINDGLRGVKGDFQLATETYARLKETGGVEVYVGMTLYEKNRELIFETVNEIAARVPGFTVRDLHVNIPHISGHYYENAKIAPKSSPELIRVLEKYMRARGVSLNPFQLVERLYQHKAKQYLASGLTPQDCGALFTTIFLNETGVVYPCSIWDLPLGSLRDHEYDLEPIMKSAAASEARRRLLKKDCPNCWTPCEAYPTLAANLNPFT